MAALCVAGLPNAAAAEGWPNQPVTVVVPFPAGGTADLFARETAQALSAELGQQFVVENRAGAGGNLAAGAVAKAAPDGGNLLFASQAQAALNSLMFKSLPYDPLRELVPAVLVIKSPLAIIAGIDAPTTSLKDVLDQARANPGKLTIGHAGIGSMGHIAAELLQQKAGIKLNGVPYRGGAPLITDLIGGHVQLACDLLSNFVRLAKDGKARLPAVASKTRMRELPDVPTIQEQIDAPLEASAWFAIMAPAGTPADVLEKINAVTNRYLQSAKGKELLAQQAVEAGGGTPAAAAAFLKEELDKWQPVIKAANIALN